MKIISVKTTSRFDRCFAKLPFKIQKEVLKKKAFFIRNPFDKRLKTHKLKGKLSKFYSFSITYSYRVMFEFLAENKVIFYDIGDHDIYR